MPEREESVVAQVAIKTDEQGRVYREIRCSECRTWLADEYIFRGRLILKCRKCGKIVLMVFRPHKKKKSGAKGSSQEVKKDKQDLK